MQLKKPTNIAQAYERVLNSTSPLIVNHAARLLLLNASFCTPSGK